jgi:hypothetical protein
MGVAVNDHGWNIFWIFFDVQYSHHEVQELLFISIKFYNVIKVLVQNDYRYISL